jgi:membrane protein DedA with SNARE-associated domain
MEWWQRLTAAAWLLLQEHGQLAAFLFLLVEEAGTPVPIPGDFLMVLAGARAAQGRLNLFEILLVMELATVLGASFLYWISARAGRRVVYRLGKHVGLTPERLDRAAEQLNRRGAMAVVVGRLTPGLRMATPIICGVFRFPFRVYLPAMALGAFLYLAFYTLLGYFFGPRILHLLESIELPLGLVLSAGLLAALAYWTVRIGRAPTPPPTCPELRERLWAGAASGLVGSLISALLANVLIHVLGLLAFQSPGRALFELARVVGQEMGRSPGFVAAWLLIPALLGVGAGLGALFGAWLGNSSYSRGPLRGALFALLPLACSLLVALPLVGAGPAGLSLGVGPIPAAGELIRHVVFGLVLGTVYPALARPRARRGYSAASQPPPTEAHPQPAAAQSP